MFIFYSSPTDPVTVSDYYLPDYLIIDQSTLSLLEDFYFCFILCTKKQNKDTSIELKVGVIISFLFSVISSFSVFSVKYVVTSLVEDH